MANGGTLRLRFDAFELDEADARLKREGVAIPVPPRAFAVLCELARQAGQLVTKEALLDAVWGHRHVSESVLKTTISELRAALGDDARQPRYIETASRGGYRFIGAALPSAASVAWRKEGEVLAERTGPVPVLDSSFDRAGVRPLIGREGALAQLREAWARTQAGERQLVWLAGEAGIGKTSLVERFVSELEPGTAIFGQCVEDFGTGEPYLPILGIVQELCRSDPHLVNVLRTVAPTWLVQLPRLIADADRAQLLTDVGGAHQDRMVREMHDFMQRIAQERARVFVIEDLHWSDTATLRVMEHFARRQRNVRILWIASFRLNQVMAGDHRLRGLRQELRLLKLCREILLEPFSEVDLSTYLAQRIPQVGIAENFVRRLHEHTDGLPLFVANVADHLLAQTRGNEQALGALTQAQSAAPLPVPDSLAGVIEKQIEQLPEETQALLEAASVLGMEFRASNLAAVLERNIDWVCDECDQLVRRQFWLKLVGMDELPDNSVDPRYAFLHALYKHVFYERAPLPQRVQRHRRVLQALELASKTGATVAATELAIHAARGHQFSLALRYYGEAADQALGHFAPTEALELASTGLKLLGRVAAGTEKAELELGLVHRRGVASAQLFGVASREAIVDFERSLELCNVLPPTAMRGLLMSGLGLTRYVSGDYAGAERLAIRVRGIGEQHNDDVLRVSANLLLGMLQAAKGDHAMAVDTMEAGIAACQRIASIPVGVLVVDPSAALHANVSVPLMQMGRYDQARAHLDKAHARAAQLGQPTAMMLAWWAEGMLHVRAEEPMRVIESATVLGRVVAKSMLTQGEGPARWLRGWALAQAGKAREGHRLIREGFEMHERLSMFAGNTETLGYAAEALVLARDWIHADRQLDDAMALGERIGEFAMYPYLLRLRAEVAVGQDDPPKARELLRESLKVAHRQRATLDELKALTALCKHGLASRCLRAGKTIALHEARRRAVAALMRFE
jgi:DNA-binding winged helix-turn-helix (wHTH) protein/tetratricopeptide (TPR) repeat protein